MFIIYTMNIFHERRFFMTLQQLEVFIKVSETGSFTKAGELLSLTQSAISHIISSLEIELGFTLLYRNRSGITITNEGKKILQHALDILNKTELLKQEASSIIGIESGTLKIGCFPSVSAKILPTMTSKGLGISIVPEILLEFTSLKLKIIKLVPKLSRNIGVLLKSHKTASPASLSFIKEAQTYLK